MFIKALCIRRELILEFSRNVEFISAFLVFNEILKQVQHCEVIFALISHSIKFYEKLYKDKF